MSRTHDDIIITSCHHALMAMCNMPASSVWIDTASPIQRRFSCRHYNGAWWWHHHYTASADLTHNWAYMCIQHSGPGYHNYVLCRTCAGGMDKTKALSLSPSFLTCASFSHCAINVWQVFSTQGLGPGNKSLPDPRHWQMESLLWCNSPNCSSQWIRR